MLSNHLDSNQAWRLLCKELNAIASLITATVTMRTSRLCSSLASILGLTAAYKNQFIVPPPSDGLGGWDSDKVYALGSTVQFSWRTEWPNVSLGVWHIPPGEVNGILYNLVKQGITGFDRNSVWKVDVELSAWFNPALGPGKLPLDP